MAGRNTSSMHGKHAANESTLLRQILLEVSHGPVRLFRNNTGVGWAGKAEVCRNEPRTVTLQPGDVVVRRARPLHAGLCEGSADLVGWRSLLVEPRMVGHKYAIFAGLEVKAPFGVMRSTQTTFQNEVLVAGGIAATARSVDDAIKAMML